MSKTRQNKCLNIMCGGNNMFRNYSYYYDKLEDVNREFQSVKIEGYTGRWSAIQKIEIDDKVYYIFEHDYYGDETC